MTTFIYRKINGRIVPEKWNHDHVNSATGKPHDLKVIFKKELTDKEKSMSIAELEMTYPIEGIK